MGVEWGQIQPLFHAREALSETFPVFFDAHSNELAAAAGLVIVLLVFLILHAFRSFRHSKKQVRRYMLLADVSEEYMYEYDFSRDVLSLTARCSALLGAPSTISKYRKNPASAILMSDGLDITEGESREVAVGQSGTFRIVNSVIRDKRNRPEYLIGKLVNISEEKARLHMLAVKAETDGLTGVYNAATTHDLVRDRYEKQRIVSSALLIVDLDNFKQINDTYGHYMGDSVLVDFANMLRETFRDTDIIGRVGGDEFCVHAVGSVSETTVMRKFHALRANLRRDSEEKGRPQMTLSVGVLLCNGHELSFAEAYQRADAALYEVKKNGRDGCRIIRYSSETEQQISGRETDIDVPGTGEKAAPESVEAAPRACNRRVLIVDDNAMNRNILRGILQGVYEVLTAENGQEALAVLDRETNISAVILDIIMPVMDGFEVLERMRVDARLSKIPVIVATGSPDEGTEAKSLYLGASDFIAKPFNPLVIRRRLANSIELRETAELVNAVEEDELTGLLRREFFYKKADAILAEASDTVYDLICCDIERFKLINELFGRRAGDALLRYIAGQIRRNTPGAALLGRIGGDRFACLLPHREAYEDTDFAASETTVNAFPISLHIKVCYGIYAVTDTSLPASTMCDRALTAADSVKGKYGVRFAWYDDTFRMRRLAEQTILDGMRAGIRERQFEVWYQPKFDLTRETVTGAEALVRWAHPEKGLLQPGVFIPLFERNGFITDLDVYAWETACSDLSRWIEAGNMPIPVSVNVSRADIYHPALTEILTGLVQKYGLSPQLLHLEITETAYMENSEQLIAMVKELKTRGFLIEMDDFGAGYSSLNMLAELPINVLKLDMHFISRMADARSRSVLGVVLNLAEKLGLPVVAEGVETKEQAEELREMGCGFAQGYYFARPQTREAFEQHLRHMSEDMT